MSGGTELDRLYYTFDAELSPYQKKLKELEGAAATTGENIGKHLGKGGEGAEKLHRGIELSRRELLYAGREVATGDWARLPSTFALITSHLTGMTTAGILAGGAIAGPFIAMGLAAYQSERAMNSLETSIRRVGAAAGVTPGQVLAFAQGQSIPGVSSNGALAMSAALLGRGNLSGAQLPGAVRAASLYSQAEGLDQSKGAAAFEKILGDPTKGAIELHDAMKLLSSAQMDQISHLQREGSIRDAQNIIISATTARLQGLNDQAGPLTQTFQKLGREAGSWWSSFGRAMAVQFGISNATPEEQLSWAGDRLGAMRKGGIWDPASGKPFVRGQTSLTAYNAVQGQWDYWNKQVTGQQSDATHGQALQEADDRTKEFVDRMRGVDPQFGKADNYRDYITAAKRSMQDWRGALADKRTSPEDRARDQRLMSEGQRSISAYEWAIRTGKDPSNRLNADYEDPAVRRKHEAETAISGANSVTSAYGQSVSAGRAAEIQARVAQEIAGLKKGEAPPGYAGLLTQKDTADDAERRAKQLAENLQKMGNENNLLQRHSELMGVDNDTREKLLAEQTAVNQITEEYGDLSSKAAQAALAATLKEVDAKQALLKTIKDVNDEQQNELSIANKGADMLGSVFDKLNQGGKALKQIFPDIGREILKTVEELAIINPIKNGLQGIFSPGSAKTPLPTMGSLSGVLGKLFGGGGGGGAGGGGGIGNALSGAFNWIGNLFGSGGAWSGGVRYAANGMVLGGATMFATSGGPVIGGELGHNSEALMPLARGPGGVLGVRAHGGVGRSAPVIHQHINIHPDVSTVARGEIMKMMPTIKTSAVAAVSEAMSRGVPMGGGTI